MKMNKNLSYTMKGRLPNECKFAESLYHFIVIDFLLYLLKELEADDNRFLGPFYLSILLLTKVAPGLTVEVTALLGACKSRTILSRLLPCISCTGI